MRNPATVISFLALATLPSLAMAGNGSSLSETETAYTGAQILVGDRDVTFETTGAGKYAEGDQDRYAFFSGNTLYVGVEDMEGNALDAIVEFFWFESSIDRGSDFYVAVVKARTTPHVSEGWCLAVDYAPVLRVEAETDISGGTQGFRWDWSLPFENYGMESYGEVTMNTSYGIGASSEGSAIVAEKVEEDGTTAEVNVQTKGYINADYMVQAAYQVTLYRWDMVVRGSPNLMRWELNLNTTDREEQNAYHEYFLVMQTEEDTPFTIDSLDFSAGLEDFWFWENTTLGVSISDITVQRPEGWESAIDDDDTGTPWDPEDTDAPDDDPGDDDPTDDDPADDDPADDTHLEGSRRCSTIPSAPAGLLMLSLGLGLAVRRRR